jgi:hypothetical protein
MTLMLQYARGSSEQNIMPEIIPPVAAKQLEDLITLRWWCGCLTQLRGTELHLRPCSDECPVGESYLSLARELRVQIEIA